MRIQQEGSGNSISGHRTIQLVSEKRFPFYDIDHQTCTACFSGASILL